jgi:hypothetical protein
MKTFKVLKKTEKTIQTKFGPKQKYSFQLDAGKGAFWAGAWKNSITESWREGGSYEMDVRPREYEGKQYFDIYTPKPQDEMLAILKRIEAKLDKFFGETAEELPPEAETETEPPPDNIPY